MARKNDTDLLGRAMAALTTGEISDSRDNVADCFVAVVAAAGAVWLDQPSSPLALEIDALLAALQRKDEPLLQGLPRPMRMLLRTALHTITKKKEKARGRETPVENPAPEIPPEG